MNALKLLSVSVLLYAMPLFLASIMFFVQGICFLFYPGDGSMILVGLALALVSAAGIVGYVGGWKYVMKTKLRQGPSNSAIAWAIFIGLLPCLFVLGAVILDPGCFESTPIDSICDVRLISPIIVLCGIYALASLGLKALAQPQS